MEIDAYLKKFMQHLNWTSVDIKHVFNGVYSFAVATISHSLVRKYKWFEMFFTKVYYL